MRRMQILAWIGALGLGFVALGGCATKGFVKENVAEVRERVNRMESRIDENEESAQTALDRTASLEGDVNRIRSFMEGRTGYEQVAQYEVHFGFDRARLNDEAKATLDRVAREASENPQWVVELYGFADPRGSADYNTALAQRRVDTVERYLVDRKMGPLQRIRTISFGEEIPPAYADEQADHAEQRRVTIVTLQRKPAEERGEMTQN
ncbi:MAG: OmpA family protein [Candidatus Eisenbacteria bacterium]|nr:OmpA family protein [Candidatus Latescibacterota bacterium]MBD3302602.1 OmpA family protein [Candidatus Eisenbacteria bacterium]